VGERGGEGAGELGRVVDLAAVRAAGTGPGGEVGFGRFGAGDRGNGSGMTDAAVLDVDGTLVDTNYHHALAWWRAFGRCGLTVPVWRLHRAIGMGGDRLVAAVAGDRVEAEHGDDIRAAWEAEFAPMLAEVRPLPDVERLFRTLTDRGCEIVLASSGKPEHVEHYLDLIDGRKYAAASTTSEDVEDSKPAPDLLQVALSRVAADRALMIGDSTWDCQAARRLQLPAIGLLTGGFGAAELRDAGAIAVYETLAELAAALAEPGGLPLRRPQD
jgi:HAD superfamily hydrolase (TIGR01549 family)